MKDQQQDEILKVVTAKDIQGTSMELAHGSSYVKALVAKDSPVIADFIKKNSNYDANVSETVFKVYESLGKLIPKIKDAELKKELQKDYQALFTSWDKLDDQSQVLSYVSNKQDDQQRSKKNE